MRGRSGDFGNGSYPGWGILEGWEKDDVLRIMEDVHRETGLRIKAEGAWRLWSEYSGCVAAGWLVGAGYVEGMLYEVIWHYRGEVDDERELLTKVYGAS